MAGIRAMGAKLAYTVGSDPEKFVAHLTSLGSLELDNTEIDVTDHDSPDGKKEYIQGEQEYANVAFSGNVAAGDDTFERIWALCNSQDIIHCEARYANGKTAQFDASFSKVAMGEQTTDGLMTYSGELKVTGAVTWISGGSSSE